MSEWKTIVDVSFCEPCIMDGSKCTLITLMERGFIPGTKIRVLQELGDKKLVEIKGEGQWAIENKLYDQIKKV